MGYQRRVHGGRSWMQRHRSALIAGVSGILLCATIASVAVLRGGSPAPTAAGSALAVAQGDTAVTESLWQKSRFLGAVWIYSGEDVDQRYEEPYLERLARRHHYGIKIHHLSSLRDAPLRSALWQSDIPTFIFPPFEASYPEISKLAAQTCVRTSRRATTCFSSAATRASRSLMTSSVFSWRANTSTDRITGMTGTQRIHHSSICPRGCRSTRVLLV